MSSELRAGRPGNEGEAALNDGPVAGLRRTGSRAKAKNGAVLPSSRRALASVCLFLVVLLGVTGGGLSAGGAEEPDRQIPVGPLDFPVRTATWTSPTSRAADVAAVLGQAAGDRGLLRAKGIFADGVVLHPEMNALLSK